MDATIQLDGLDKFLTAIHGEPTNLAGMIEGLGFEAAQRQWLQEERMQAVAAQLVEAVRKKLTNRELDLWFRVLNRRFGLDGEPAMRIEEAARALNVAVEEASRAESDALQKCRYKNTLQDLKKELRRIALDELSKGGERPAKQDVAGKLNRLADLHAAVDLTRIDYEAKRAEILKKVQAELDALGAEYEPILAAAQENASTLETEIKNDVLLAGESVVTDVYQAIYMKGRVSWDNEGISNYARAHPEVLKYRREGQPSVSLRTAGKPSKDQGK
jgi:hypothetical protein